MRSRKPLIGVGFLAIFLLVVLIVVPAAASATPGGSGGGKPVNWANFVFNSNNDPGAHTMDAIHVEALDGAVLRGKYLDQSVGKPGPLEYRFSSRNFGPAYFCHGADYPEDLWPSEWFWGLPSNWDTFVNADIADFVVYVPADQLPPAWLQALPEAADSLALRYVLLDFGEPGKGNDQYMAWAFFPDNPGSPSFWLWFPMTETGDPVPVPTGNIQVHVGVSDF